MASMGPQMASQGNYPIPPMASMGPGSMGPQKAAQNTGWLPGVSRPQMTQVANPPVVSNNIQYGPSYQMSYAKRSAADKTAVKYTGFLPLEGVYEEDTCRIG